MALWYCQEMDPLPIDEILPEVLAALRRSRSVVLAAPPGAGKTTRVPPAIVRAGLLEAGHPTLILLQPRRVAARAAAARMAEENGWALGDQVGYHVRFDKRLGPATRIRVLTEGILTRQLVRDAFLPGIGAVILDEFHERSIDTDLAIGLLREIQQSVRPDLVLVVMSATLEAEPIAAFLARDGAAAPIVRSAGRVFPVEICHAPAGDLRLAERVARAVVRVLEETPSGPERAGDVLAFLPARKRFAAPRSTSKKPPGRGTSACWGCMAVRRWKSRLPRFGRIPRDAARLCWRRIWRRPR